MSVAGSRVIVNGEAVVFDGPAPATVQEAVSLVDGALVQQGQIIESCTIDGQPLSDDPNILNKTYQTVEIHSRTWDLVCGDSVREAYGSVRGAMVEASAFGASMLVVPLGQVMKEIDKLAQKLGVIVKPLEVANEFAENFGAPWRAEVALLTTRVQEACEAFSYALEHQDVGKAADVLCIVLPKHLSEFAHLPGVPWKGVAV